MVTARRAPVRTGAAPAPAAATRRGPVTTSYRGEEGRRRAEEEERLAAARREMAKSNANMPFRFFCRPGESRQVVIVDEAPDFYRHEHNAKDARTGKWSLYFPCLKEAANCAGCKTLDRPSYYAMYLTIIDLEPYTNRDGEEIPWSKKLLVVKLQQQKKFTRLLERHGTLRGMVIQLTRDTEKDASIGNDIEFVEFMEEAELGEYVTSYEYEDSQGNKKVKDIVGYEPFDYDELFPPMTEQQLRAIVGGSAEPGSEEHDDRAIGRRRGRGASEFDDDAPPARTRPARRAAEVEEEPADPPQRTRRRVVEEPAEEEVVEETAPTTRLARRPAAAPAPARAVARRAARPDPEAEEEPVEEPARPASSLAERRRLLRRGA